MSRESANKSTCTLRSIKAVEGRALLLYYYEGIRQREYNGNILSLPIYPNKAKTKSDKVKLLKKLKFEFEKALELLTLDGGTLNGIVCG